MESTYIQHLSLTNFRNYTKLELELPLGVALFLGDNAQGKTNLLEAIYYLATTRSLQAAGDGQLINWSAAEEDIPFARIVAQVRKGSATHQVEILLLKESTARGVRFRKRIKVNGINRRALDLIGQVNVVLFLPQDLRIVNGPPSLRRRYLNATICQIDPSYCRALQRYRKVLVQRNHLLRQLRERGGAPDELTFWDQRLVEDGAHLIGRRQDVVAELDRLTERVHYELTAQRERLQLLYNPSIAPDRSRQGQLGPSTEQGEAILSIPTVEGLFRERLREMRAKEILQGMTLVGPQRDDLHFLVNERGMNPYGSRGQQRTITLSLKLAEVQLVRSEVGFQPVLLLDDVMSELDASRRLYLMGMIDPAQQVLITATDLASYAADFLRGAILFKVQEGKIERTAPAQP